MLSFRDELTNGGQLYLRHNKHIFLMKLMSKYSTTMLSLGFLLAVTACEQKSDVRPTTLSSGARSSALNPTIFIKGIVLSANEVIGGEKVTATVILNQPAPAGGLTVTVTKNSTNSPLLDLPRSLVVSQGDTAARIIIQTLPVIGNTIDILFGRPAPFVSNLRTIVILPRPASDPRPPLQVLEAENARLTRAVVVDAKSNQASFSGGAFVRYTRPSGGIIRFNVTPGQVGENILIFDYSPLTTSDPAFQLVLDVNGTSYPVTFPPLSKITTTSDGINTTGNISLRVPLKAGPNVVRLLTTGQGGPNIDKLTVAAP